MDKCTILLILGAGVLGFWFGFATDGGIWIPIVGAAMVCFSVGFQCYTCYKKKGICNQNKRQIQSSQEEASASTHTTTETRTSKDIEIGEPENLDPLHYHPASDPEYSDVIQEESCHSISIYDLMNQASESTVDTETAQKKTIGKVKPDTDYCVPLRKVLETEARKTYTDPLHFHPKVAEHKEEKKGSIHGVSNQASKRESMSKNAGTPKETSVRKETKPKKDVCGIAPLRKEGHQKAYDDPLHFHPKAYPTDDNVQLEEVNDGSISDISTHWIQPPFHTRKQHPNDEKRTNLETIPSVSNSNSMHHEPPLSSDTAMNNEDAEGDSDLAPSLEQQIDESVFHESFANLKTQKRQPTKKERAKADSDLASRIEQQIDESVFHESFSDLKRQKRKPKTKAHSKADSDLAGSIEQQIDESVFHESFSDLKRQRRKPKPKTRAKPDFDASRNLEQQVDESVFHESFSNLNRQKMKPARKARTGVDSDSAQNLEQQIDESVFHESFTDLKRQRRQPKMKTREKAESDLVQSLEQQIDESVFHESFSQLKTRKREPLDSDLAQSLEQQIDESVFHESFTHLKLQRR